MKHAGQGKTCLNKDRFEEQHVYACLCDCADSFQAFNSVNTVLEVLV